VIAGADSFVAEQALESLLQAAVGEDRSDAVAVFRGDEAGWGRILEAARTGSLFATRRAVVVRNADAIKGEGDEAVAYLADPSPDAALILMAVKPDKRRKPWKDLMARAQVVPAEPLKGYALKKRVADEIRARKLPLDDSAVQELIDGVGQDLRRLMGELEKLEAFAEGRKGRLSADDVSEVLGHGIGQPLYRMADALWARRPAPVLAMLEVALDEGVPNLVLLKVMHNALRQVRSARALSEQRVPPAQIAGRVGIMPFKADDLVRAARAWGDEDLKGAMAALDRADRRIKNSADSRAALQAAVVEACGRGAGPAVRPGSRTGR
jgi:DNA polymerase-3 subunit delta